MTKTVSRAMMEMIPLWNLNLLCILFPLLPEHSDFYARPFYYSPRVARGALVCDGLLSPAFPLYTLD